MTCGSADAAPGEAELAAAQRTVALACRVIAHAGLAEDVLGHVSLRLPDGRVLVRCRGPEERGLLFTCDEDIRLVDLDGGGDLGGYALPNEFPIHAEVLKARPEVTAVVHAHPPAILLAGLAGVPLRPVFGAYNIPAFSMASDGVPVYPRAVLIRTAALGCEMVAAMGQAPVCLLRGHGVTTVGSSVEQAVVRAVNLEKLARVCVGIARIGSEVSDVASEDALELPDLGSSFNDTLLWRHHLARLEQAGLAGF
jgi:ribulose-5-phosphate 4-epimerase/fuculose-1-phosphate aldolase